MVLCEQGNRHVFRAYAPHAARMQIVGDFTDWTRSPIEMKRGENGWWSGEAELPAGDFAFRYLVDGELWLTDYAANGVRLDVYGQWVSLLHVHSPERNSPHSD